MLTNNSPPSPWLTAPQALAALGVRPQTLYANVSRGRIRAQPDPQNPQRSLYHHEDVQRLASRRAGRRTVAAVAAAAIGWGDPVLPSGLSTVVDGRLWYRGQDAVQLAGTHTLEQVADLLWGTPGEALPHGSGRRPAPRARAATAGTSARTAARTPAPSSPLTAALAALAARVERDPPSHRRARPVLVAEAAGLLENLACAMLGRAPARGLPLHQRMAVAWQAPGAEDLLRRALVLLADHELNASTFAVRVAVSTGTPLSAGLLAGLATLAGPLHGGASVGARALLDAARRDGAATSVRAWLAQGHALPAFGHPLYPAGDPRAAALFACFEPAAVYAEVAAEVAALIGEKPNIDFAVSALADRFALPPQAPLAIFALARAVGWIAHAFEQIEADQLIRPRARYTGPAPRRP
ncbi:MAG: citrate synthase [Pseudomonadota bacterium]